MVSRAVYDKKDVTKSCPWNGISVGVVALGSVSPLRVRKRKARSSLDQPTCRR